MVTRRELLRRQNLQILDLEERQYKALYTNLKEARKELAKVVDNDPSNLFNRRFRDQLDSALKPFENSSVYTGEIWQAGSEMGVEILQNETNLLTTPFVNYAVVASESAESVNLIKQVSNDLKTQILRKIQVNQATGSQLQSLMQDILGTGIQGINCRNGAFRTARWRAEAIARTSVNELVNRAALATYQKADSENPLVTIGKEWVTTSDRRTSNICIGLAGQRRGLDENFSGAGWSGQYPPAHPFCRSRVIAYRMES